MHWAVAVEKFGAAFRAFCGLNPTVDLVGSPCRYLGRGRYQCRRWPTQEPDQSLDVVPFIRELHRRGAAFA